MALQATDHEPPPRGTEAEQSHLPAADLLSRLGYHCLTAEEARELRGGRSSRLLLYDVLRAQLQRINHITFRGREHAFSAANLQRAIQALEDVPLAEGTQRAGERVYDLLRLGKSLEQTVEGDTKSFTLRYVDWEHWDQNVFHAVIKPPIRRSTGHSDCEPDIVLFVNGIPFAVLECKAPTEPLSAAVSQILRYQSSDHIPELFKYVQVVLALKASEALYATAGTPAEFWSVWKGARDENPDPELEELLACPLPPAEREALLGWFVQEERAYYRTEEEGRSVTEQDRALWYLCRPERLIELAGQFILYEGGQKKIARYQQYYAVKRTMRRLTSDEGVGPRPGGVIWHSQGSGKSLTMVLLANAIAQRREIKNPRIILVTDRIDLDRQLASTFRRCGLEPRRATSGADLRRLVESPRAMVITALVQKFAAALATGELADPSREIFILVDEGHRTQYGPLHQALRKVFPNGCYLAFTGTPLLRSEKNTVAQFGGLISSYTMEEAVADHAVVPLLYERRHVWQEVVSEPMDLWFERRLPNATPEMKADYKRKFSRAQMLMKTEKRLELTAFDISSHYQTHWQQEGRYKAQLVAPDKKSAIQLHRFLQGSGVTSEVIISPPEEKEGYEAPDERVDDLVKQFWQQMMQRFGTEETYNETLISQFKCSEAPEILIVVDKLITGFDVPRNTVLYLARRLTSHTLLQAIARVNRIYADKEFGYILDYAGVLGELDRALTEYKALAGFDPQDLVGILENVREEVAKLPARHTELLNLFKGLQRRGDMEEYERSLEPEDRRKHFYKVLNAYSRCLRIALSTEFFYQETPTDLIGQYRDDLRFFQKLRASVQLRYAEAVEFRKLEPQVAKLLDEYVLSNSVESLTPEPIDIFDTAAMEKALAGRRPAAQADTIAHQMERTITERMDEDPAFYRKFSEMVQATIDAFREEKLRDEEYLRRIQELRGRFVTRTDSGLPHRLAGREIAQAYYRVVMEQIDHLALQPGDRETAAEIALMIDHAIEEHRVVDWQRKPDVQNQMRESIDDGFYHLSEKGIIRLDWEALDEINAEVDRIARSRL